MCFFPPRLNHAIDFLSHYITSAMADQTVSLTNNTCKNWYIIMKACIILPPPPPTMWCSILAVHENNSRNGAWQVNLTHPASKGFVDTLFIKLENLYIVYKKICWLFLVWIYIKSERVWRTNWSTSNFFRTGSQEAVLSTHPHAVMWTYRDKMSSCMSLSFRDYSHVQDLLPMCKISKHNDSVLAILICGINRCIGKSF